MEDADLSSQVKQAFGRYQFERSSADVVRHRQRPVRRSLVALGTAVAALAIWGLNAAPFAGSPTAAFAGWQPVPTSPDRSLAAAAEDACLTDTTLPQMTLVAQDQRGNAATLLYAGGGELAICLVLRDAKADVVTAASGVTHLAATVEPLSVDTALSAPRSANSAGMTIVAGRVGPSVSGVRVARADGVAVEATVSAGHFVAWWPTQDAADSILALDRGGRPVITVPGLK